MIDYKDKIRKLLALAESPNENEARAALLKARELMAKYKIREADLEEAKKQAVRDVKTDITCSKRRDPWVVGLAAVIGENYCCKGYRSRYYGKQTQTICFIGLEDDVEICTAIFKYAVDCIKAGAKTIKKELAEYYPEYIRQQCDSYGFGFTEGIKTAFDGQNAEKRGEWGLILVTPKEVQEATQSFSKAAFNSRAENNIDPYVYAQGYADGEMFDPAHRLGEGASA